MNSILPQNPVVNKTIQVTNIRLGQGDIIATLDVRVGGIFIRNVSLRRGRGDTIYVNYPSFRNEHGRWVHSIEITSPQLEAYLREEIFRAVTEAVR